METSSPLDNPNDWPVRSLREITTKIGSGATPTGGEATYLPARKNWALVRSQNIFDRYFDANGLAFISDSQAAKLSNVVLEPNDILLNITGDGVTFARSALIPDEVLPAVVNQHVAIIRVDKSVADPGYVLSYLTHPYVKHYIESFNAGGSRRAITKGHIESFVLPLPPLPEQRAIAHILGTLDDKIELNRRMNQTLEEIARAIFKSWFVDFDPVKAKTAGRQPVGMDAETAALFPSEFEDSELGLIPVGWSVGTLGDVASHPRRSIKPDEMDSATPYISLEHMPRRSISLTDWGTADGLESNKFIFRKGELLFGKLRPYFHKVGIAPVDGICSTDIVVITPINEALFGYVLGHISSENFVDYANASSTGTRMPRTNWQDMSRYPVVLPSLVVVSAYTKLIKPLTDRINTSIYESRSLAALRDTLLPKLISGELRVCQEAPAL